EVFAPAATVALHGHTLAAGMLLQQRQREPPQPGNILAQVPIPNPRFVLAISDIEAPVTAILDPPMTPDGVGESLHTHREAADVVADFDGLLPLTKAAGRRHPDRLQPCPLRHPRQILRGRELQIRALLLTSMTLFSRHMLTSLGQVPL